MTEVIKDSLKNKVKQSKTKNTEHFVSLDIQKIISNLSMTTDRRLQTLSFPMFMT